MSLNGHIRQPIRTPGVIKETDNRLSDPDWSASLGGVVKDLPAWQLAPPPSPDFKS